jgi:Flp pilus assembly protein TadD
MGGEAMGTAALRLRRALFVVLLGLGLGGCSALGTPAPGSPEARLQETLAEAQRARDEVRARAVAEPPPPSLTEKLQEGDALRDAGDTSRALWTYLQAHELDRKALEPLARIASLHLGVEPERALALFAGLAREHPRSALPHTGLGLAWLALGRDEEALGALERAAALEPPLPAAHSALGVVLDRLGRYEEAQAAYRRTLAVSPHDYDALNNLGVSLLLSGDAAAAVTALQRAARLEPRDPAVHNNLGLALGRLGRYEEALAAFRRAGGEQVALHNLATVRLMGGDYQGAIADAERALLVPGPERLAVLRTLRAARRALDEERTVPPAAPFEEDGAEVAPGVPSEVLRAE